MKLFLIKQRRESRKEFRGLSINLFEPVSQERPKKYGFKCFLVDKKS